MCLQADPPYLAPRVCACGAQLFFHVSSKKSCKKTDAERFSRLIREALHDMRLIFE
jgi:hypothetical protein